MVIAKEIAKEFAVVKSEVRLTRLILSDTPQNRLVSAVGWLPTACHAVVVRHKVGLASWFL